MIVVSQKKQRYHLEELGQKNRKIYISFLDRWVCVGKYRSIMRTTQVMSELYDASVSGKAEFYMPEE